MKTTDPAKFAQAYGRANLQNVREAKALIQYSIDTYNAVDLTEATAAGIRYGHMEGKRESKEQLRQLHQRYHELKTEYDKLLKEATRLTMEAKIYNDDPEKLRGVIATMSGRLAVLEAEQATGSTDPAAADLRGSADNDVNSDGIQEV